MPPKDDASELTVHARHHHATGALGDDADRPRHDEGSHGADAFLTLQKDAAQGRRLLALAEVYDGGTRTDAARIGGVGLQTIRDWVLAFNREGPAGLVDGKAPGQPSKLNDDQRRALARVVESGP